MKAKQVEPALDAALPRKVGQLVNENTNRLHLQQQIDTSPRLYLLHDRQEPLEAPADVYRVLFFLPPPPPYM